MTAYLTLPTPLGPFAVYPEGTITRTLQEGRWWDRHLNPILNEAEPGCAIDIGAHFGWFTIYLAQRHERVIAVEPYPESFRLLTGNVRARPQLEDHIQCWPVAAYDTTATLQFDRRNDTTDAGTVGFTRAGPGAAVPPAPCFVAGVRLDDYLQASPPVTLIKCDAQGADLRALVGLRATIARDRPLIVFEWEEGMAGWQGDTWPDYVDFFAELNYTVARITQDYWDFVARPC